MRQRIISSARDLADWVNDHSGDNLSQVDMDSICSSIWHNPRCPNWGDDWSEFLASLPDPLLSLIEA